MRDVIHKVQANETDEIVVHRLAEIAADCAWCERNYRENNNSTKIKSHDTDSHEA